MLSRKVSYHVSIAHSRHRWIGRDDLESAAWLGAADALSKADNEREAGFSRYAAARIEGSILDEIRRQSRYASRFPLFREVPGDKHYRYSPRSRDAILAQADIERILAQAGLSVRQANALRLYYWEDHTLAEISTMFGIHETGASQILQATIDKIRRSLHVRAHEHTDTHTAA